MSEELFFYMQATGEDYNVEAGDDRRPFRALLDVGLVRTTTGNRVFGALKVSFRMFIIVNIFNHITSIIRFVRSNLVYDKFRIEWLEVGRMLIYMQYAIFNYQHIVLCCCRVHWMAALIFRTVRKGLLATTKKRSLLMLMLIGSIYLEDMWRTT